MNGGRVSAVSRPSDRCLLMCTETNASKSSRSEIGRLSWSLPGFGIGVMEKRFDDVGSMR